MNDQLTLYLLTIRGTLSPDTLEAARNIHNMTAGDPDGVAAAKSLGGCQPHGLRAHAA